MDKKTLIAILLSFVILISFDMGMRKFYPQMYTKAQPAATITKTNSAATEGSIKSFPSKITTPTELSIEHAQIYKGTIENDMVTVEYSSIGGCITKISHKKFIDPKTKNPMIIMQLPKSTAGLFSIWNIDNTLLANKQFVNEPSPAQTTPHSDVVLSYNLNGSLRITKKFSLKPGSEILDVEFTFENLTQKDYPLDYTFVTGIENLDLKNQMDSRYAQIITSVNTSTKENVLKKISSTSVFKKPISIEGKINWVSTKEKYFSVIVSPEPIVNLLTSTVLSSESLRLDAFVPKNIIPANQKINHRFSVYLGPNEYDRVALYKINGIEQSLSGGPIWFLGQVLLKVLRFLNNIVHNLGLAIIILTFLISVCLYPFTRKSLESMKKMQQLQPELTELKNKYKNDPQKLNKETLEVWKKHKINPMGGCLPMLLQMPVFFALFNILGTAIELKGAKFLWIKDLSMPDALATLSFNIPLLGNEINLLPLLTIVVMFVQQKSSTQKNADSQQKMMMFLMPVMFGFIFYHFPAGCVLYFLTSSITTVAFQFLVTVKKED